MKYADTAAGAVIVALAAIIGLAFLNLYTPSLVLTSPQASLTQWLLTYRLLDVVFISLLVFAAVVAASALFRSEGTPEAGEIATFEEEATEEEEE